MNKQSVAHDQGEQQSIHDGETEAYIELLSKIIETAIDDWRDCFGKDTKQFYDKFGYSKFSKRRQMIIELSMFFSGEWFEEICEYISDEPERLIESIRNITINSNAKLDMSLVLKNEPAQVVNCFPNDGHIRGEQLKILA